MMLELVLSSLGCAALCYSLGRYNRTLALQRWQFVLTAPEERALESLRSSLELDSALARQALDAAVRARDTSRAADAITVLRVALSVLEEAGADRLTRLRAMAVYSRMVQAIRPLPTPSPDSFRAVRLKAVAVAGGFVHGFLVGTQERFRLWLVLMRLGVGIVLSGGRRAVDEAVRVDGKLAAADQSGHVANAAAQFVFRPRAACKDEQGGRGKDPRNESHRLSSVDCRHV
jgi:hypothetical protein